RDHSLWGRKRTVSYRGRDLAKRALVQLTDRALQSMSDFGTHDWGPPTSNVGSSRRRNISVARPRPVSSSPSSLSVASLRAIVVDSSTNWPVVSSAGSGCQAASFGRHSVRCAINLSACAWIGICNSNENWFALGGYLQCTPEAASSWPC